MLAEACDPVLLIVNTDDCKFCADLINQKDELNKMVKEISPKMRFVWVSLGSTRDLHTIFPATMRGIVKHVPIVLYFPENTWHETATVMAERIIVMGIPEVTKYSKLNAGNTSDVFGKLNTGRTESSFGKYSPDNIVWWLQDVINSKVHDIGEKIVNTQVPECPNTPDYSNIDNFSPTEKEAINIVTQSLINSQITNSGIPKCNHLNDDNLNNNLDETFNEVIRAWKCNQNVNSGVPKCKPNELLKFEWKNKNNSCELSYDMVCHKITVGTTWDGKEYKFTMKC